MFKYDISDLLKSSKSQLKPEDIIRPINDFRRGANWILTLLDMDADEQTPEVKLFISDFITRYKKEL